LGLVPEIESLVTELIFDRVQPARRKLFALRGLVRSTSLSVGYFHSPSLQEKIDAIIEDQDIEAFFCSSSPMAEYLYRSRHMNGKILNVNRIMDLIDIDSYKWYQYAKESPTWMSWIYRREAKHLAEYERRIAREFRHVLVVTDQEKCFFPKVEDTQNLYSMSNGVDLEYFMPAQTRNVVERRPTLVFTGVMSYPPNIEGVKWFVESVFPRIQSAVPDVRLLIVGSKPTREVKRMGLTRGVVVTGFVEDVRKYLAKAHVCIVPLRMARGIQNKVLEAMAMGKAVVCTPQAYEGISAVRGKEISVADGAEAFATAVQSLLENRTRAEQMGIYARRCVERHYSWESHLSLLDQLVAIDQQPSDLSEMSGRLNAARS
jgi:sugar transferase (PEP-CTERM/EpsH1 system associated)